jgi:hypothetical protein
MHKELIFNVRIETFEPQRSLPGGSVNLTRDGHVRVPRPGRANLCSRVKFALLCGAKTLFPRRLRRCIILNVPTGRRLTFWMYGRLGRAETFVLSDNLLIRKVRFTNTPLKKGGHFIVSRSSGLAQRSFSRDLLYRSGTQPCPEMLSYVNVYLCTSKARWKERVPVKSSIVTGTGPTTTCPSCTNLNLDKGGWMF